MSVLCSIVVPMYNEEEVVQVTYQRLTDIMEKSKFSYEIGRAHV